MVRIGFVCLISFLFVSGTSLAQTQKDWTQKLENCEIVHEGINFWGFAKDYNLDDIDLDSLTGSIAIRKVRLECASELNLSAQYLELSTGSEISPSDLLKKLKNGHFDTRSSVSSFPFFSSVGPKRFDTTPANAMAGYLCMELSSTFFGADLNAESQCRPTERTLIVDRIPFAPPGATGCKFRVIFKSKGHLAQVISNPLPKKCAYLSAPIIRSEIESLATFIKYLDVQNDE